MILTRTSNLGDLTGDYGKSCIIMKYNRFFQLRNSDSAHSRLLVVNELMLATAFSCYLCVRSMHCIKLTSNISIGDLYKLQVVGDHESGWKPAMSLYEGYIDLEQQPHQVFENYSRLKHTD